MNTKSKSNNLKKLLALTLFGVNVNAADMDFLNKDIKLTTKDENLTEEVAFIKKELEEARKLHNENTKNFSVEIKKKKDEDLTKAEETLEEFKKNNPNAKVGDNTTAGSELEKKIKAKEDAKKHKEDYEAKETEHNLKGQNLDKLEAIVKHADSNSFVKVVKAPYDRMFSDVNNFDVEITGEGESKKYTIKKERDSHNLRFAGALVGYGAIVGGVVYGIYKYTSSSDQEGSEVATGTVETAA